MSGKKDRKGGKSQAPAVMSPFMIMSPEMISQWQAQMANMNAPSTSGANKAATVSKAPWSSESSSSEDEDLQMPAKKPKLPMAPKAPNFPKDVAHQATKRKVGRPKKLQTLVKEKEKEKEGSSEQKIIEQNIVDNYPSVGPLHLDTMAHSTKEECKGCKLWKGVYAVIPCGHAKFCNYCITRVKEEADNMQRPGKCPSDSCYKIITSWVKLFNISP